jgi:hypothetical protein
MTTPVSTTDGLALVLWRPDEYTGRYLYAQVGEVPSNADVPIAAFITPACCAAAARAHNAAVTAGAATMSG